MPNIAVGQLATYTTDFGTTVVNLRFKMRGDKLATCGYTPAPDNICGGTGNLFTPRALVGEYPDGSSIRFPVASIGDIDTIRACLVADGAACIHLEGERWRFVPPSVVGATGGSNAAYTLPDGFADKETGTFDYASELLGNVKARYALELNPPAIVGAIKGCLDGWELGNVPCSSDAVISPRHFTVLARNTNGGIISRKAKASAPGPILRACGQSLLGVGYCIRYQGESARNINIF